MPATLEPLPAMSWRGPATTCTTGANGGSAVNAIEIPPTDKWMAVQTYVDELWMSRWARERLVKLATEQKWDARTKQDLHNEIDRVADRLAAGAATPVERRLAEVAALDWFALRVHEARYHSAKDDRSKVMLREHAQRSMERTYRRLMGTLRTLAAVQRLGVPAGQVTVAEQLVNVAGG